MPIMSGWEVSPDRLKAFEKMLETDPVGDPIITTKCKLGGDLGFLIAADNGFAWRIHGTGGFKATSIGMIASAGKSKWVRWHDVERIDLRKEGVLLVYVKIRQKDGAVKRDGKGNPKTKKWQLLMGRNKDEDKGHFSQRRAAFFDVMTDIFNQNKGDTDPPTSDSRI